MKLHGAAVLLGLLATVTPGHLTQAREVQQALPQTPPKVCQDSTGKSLTGDLDVLTILDNSRSLSESDPSGQRFDALEQFLSSFARTRSNQRKNFGLVKFGGSASRVIPMREVTEDNWQSVIDEVRTKIPNDKEKQDRYTNYVKALDEALAIFRARPATNCKVLIWFTDGVYDTSDSRKVEEDASDAADLRNRVCSKNGLATQIIQQNISTFVVYLTPASDPELDGAYKGRASASKDAMQAITGDSQPTFDGRGSRKRSPVEGCNLGSHLGEVLAASDAGQLLGYLVDLVEVADGGQPIFKSDCPYIANELESVQLPSPYFIDWLSIATWTDSLPSTTDLIIKSSRGEVDFDSVFALEDSSSRADRSIHYVPRKDVRDTLSPGWSLKVKNSSDLCIRIKATDLQFELSQKQPQISPTNPEDLPRQFFEGLLELSDKSGSDLSVSAALRASEIEGRLPVQFGDVLAQGGILPARIVINGLFRIEPRNCELAISHVGEELQGQVVKSANTCQVIPSSNSSTLIDASDALKTIEDNCGIGTWTLLKDDVAIDSRVTVDPGAAKFAISLSSNEKVPGKKVTCDVSGTAINITSGTASEKISIRTNLELLPKPRSFWWIIALVLVLISIALSLLLLRLVNVVTARAPRRDEFFGYVASGELIAGDLGRASIRLNGAPSEFKADPTKLVPASGDDGRTFIGVGKYRFARELPRVLKPFEETRLKFVGEQPSVFWRANSAADGLTLSFYSAVAAIASENRVPTNDRTTPIEVAVLVPKRGPDNGFDGVEKIIRQRLGDLAPQLFELLKKRESESITFSEVQGEKRRDDVSGVPPTNRSATPSSAPSDRPSSPPGRPESRVPTERGGSGVPPAPPTPRGGPPSRPPSR